MVESSLFTFFSRLAQAYVWTKTKAFYQSCTLRFLGASQFVKIFKNCKIHDKSSILSVFLRGYSNNKGDFWKKKFFKDMFCVFLMCNKINDKCMYYVINRCARFSLKLGTLDKIMSLQVKQSWSCDLIMLNLL